MAQYDDVKAGVISVVGFVSIVITFVIIVASQVLYFQYQEIEIQRKYAESPVTPGEQEIAKQNEVLSNYTWLDMEKDIVSKPIEQSKKDVLAAMTSPKINEKE